MNSSTKRSVKINLNIGDQLTAVSCGHTLVELIKFILHRRLQFPYSYQWLKHLVNEKKSRTKESCEVSYQSDRYYSVASTSLENLDFVIKNLQQEINGPQLPVEICIILGASPLSCKEAYRFLLPPYCHDVQCQSKMIASDQKIKSSILRKLITSPEFNKILTDPLPPTNMHVFVQKRVTNKQELLVNNDNFYLTSGCMITRYSKTIIIDFRSQDKAKVSCCGNFQIYQEPVPDVENNLKVKHNDHVENDESDEFEIISTDDVKWYQSIYVVKGFRDCIVNGTSVTNTW